MIKTSSFTKEQCLNCEGMTSNEVGRRFNVHPNRVWAIMNQYSLYHLIKKTRKPKINEEQIRSCIGLDCAGAAEKLSYSKTAVYEAVRRHGLEDEFGLKVAEKNHDMVPTYFKETEVNCYCCEKKITVPIADDAKSPRFICEECKKHASGFSVWANPSITPYFKKELLSGKARLLNGQEFKQAEMEILNRRMGR